MKKVILFMLFNLIFIMILKRRYYYNHVANGDIETRRGSASWPRPDRQEAAKAKFTSRIVSS